VDLLRMKAGKRARYIPGVRTDAAAQELELSA
jgi:hypothetical protein